MSCILCQVCQATPWHDLPRFPDESCVTTRSSWPNFHRIIHRDTLEDLPDPFGFHHHAGLENVRNASASGCELCRMIEIEADALLVDIAERNLKHSQSSRVLTRKDPADPSFDLWITRRPEGGDGFWMVTKSASAPDRLLYLVATFGFCSENGTAIVLR